MRQIKRIGFLFYSCLLLAAGFYGHIKYQEWFYPGQQTNAELSSDNADAENALEASAASGRITCDTLLVVHNYDLQTREETETAGKVAEKYIGMNREEFLKCIADESGAPTLQERRAGLSGMEVISFSENRIVLKKYYQKPQKTEKFYLALAENKVIVYEEDQSTIYMRTSIDGRKLPQELRNEILRGKELPGKADLENFLVSYAG